jgi:2-keto-3-deoxy-L-rhamnonate aldolase RhmA
MRQNSLLQAFRTGNVATALFVTIPDPFVAEVLGRSKLDALVIDTEHSAMSADQLQSLLMAVYPGDPTAVVRVPANDDAAIKQALDLGAEVVLVPGISSAEQCAAMVASCYYPPKGARGFGPRRASRLHGDRADYLARANDEVAVLAMVESIEGVDSIEEILAVPGLSGVFIGVADLAVSMGYLADMGNPEVDQVAQRISAAALAARIPFGVFTGNEAGAKRWIERGAQLVTVGADLQFIDAGLAQSEAVAARLADVSRPSSPVRPVP